MESNYAMVRRYRNSGNMITILPLLKVGGMQLFKMEGPDSTEKILPRTIEGQQLFLLT